MILPGGEPFFFPGSSTGCLLIHGFTASPQEVRGLGEHLSGLGFSVLGIRLPGHATALADLGRMRARDWIAAAHDGYHLLSGHCERVVPIGMSLGGALALILASDVRVAAAVGLSTPFRQPADWRLSLLRHLTWLVPAWPKGPPDWRDPDAQASRVAYDAYPLRAVVEVDVTLTEMRSRLGRIHDPVLLMHSSEDTFISPDNMSNIAAGITGAAVTQEPIHNSNHIITCDAARKQVFERVGEFVVRHAGVQP
jgi:carboxylesterase